MSSLGFCSDFVPRASSLASVSDGNANVAAWRFALRCRIAVPRRLSIRYRQRPSVPRRATSLAVPSTCTCLPSGPVPSIDQSTTIWAISPLTNTWRALASNGRPRLRSRSSSAEISARSVTVRPSSAMSTAPSYKVSIALILPELNRSISDGMTPSAMRSRPRVVESLSVARSWLVDRQHQLPSGMAGHSTFKCLPGFCQRECLCDHRADRASIDQRRDLPQLFAIGSDDEEHAALAAIAVRRCFGLGDRLRQTDQDASWL